jgi:hypothetical protein
MEINQVNTSIVDDEQFFAIKDHSFIFEVLRNKMYSNPIAAICREIPCNARDAHREAGKPDLPIEITLPIENYHFIKIQDFGLGISPDRIENIFINYGSSSKRNDNTQTGGFGLGSKTPFAYTDNFTIITRFDGIEYNYQAYIDETKIGKLALLSKIPTTESTGTQIIIPVKYTDFHTFSDHIRKLDRWDVLPNLINRPKLVKPQPEISTSLFDAYESNVTRLQFLVDGILYDSPSNYNFKYGHLILKYGIGEMKFSASRDNVIISKQTEADIRNRINQAQKVYLQCMQQKISEQETYIKALSYYSNMYNIFGRSEDFGHAFSWKDLPLIDCVSVPQNIIAHRISRSSAYYKRKVTTYTERVVTIHLSKNNIYVHKDTESIVSNLYYLLKKTNVCLNNVYMISGSDEDVEAFLKNSLMREVEVIKLSSLIKHKKTDKISIYYYDQNRLNFKNLSTLQIKNISKNTDDKIIVLLNNKSNQIELSSKNKICNYNSFLSLVAGQTVYGVLESQYNQAKTIIGEHKLASDIIDEKKLALDKDKVSALYFESKFNYSALNNILNYSSIINDPKIKDFINHVIFITKSLADISYVHFDDLIDQSFDNKNYFNVSLYAVEKYINDNYPLLYKISYYDKQLVTKYMNDMYELSLFRQNAS